LLQKALAQQYDLKETTKHREKAEKEQVSETYHSGEGGLTGGGEGELKGRFPQGPPHEGRKRDRQLLEADRQRSSGRGHGEKEKKRHAGAKHKKKGIGKENLKEDGQGGIYSWFGI